MNNDLRKRTLSQKGLTLVEIIVVLVILSLIMGYLTRGLFSQGEKAKAQMNTLAAKKLQNAINQYQLMYNTLPPDINSLVSCNSTSGSACVPVADEADLKDAWDTPFQYSLRDGGRGYSIKSLGSDRREGGTGVEGDMIINGP